MTKDSVSKALAKVQSREMLELAYLDVERLNLVLPIFTYNGIGYDERSVIYSSDPIDRETKTRRQDRTPFRRYKIAHHPGRQVTDPNKLSKALER